MLYLKVFWLYKAFFSPIRIRRFVFLTVWRHREKLHWICRLSLSKWTHQHRMFQFISVFSIFFCSSFIVLNKWFISWDKLILSYFTQFGINRNEIAFLVSSGVIWCCWVEMQWFLCMLLCPATLLDLFIRIDLFLTESFLFFPHKVICDQRQFCFCHCSINIPYFLVFTRKASLASMSYL